MPPSVDERLRALAMERGLSLNDAVIEALARGVGLDPGALPQRDLSSFTGSWVEDAAVEEALAAQRIVDPDLWR